MSKVIKKKIKIPIDIKDQNLSEMFNQMLGTGAVNMSIAYPRYVRIRGLTDQLLKLFEMFNGSPFMAKYREFAAEHAEIAAFVSHGRESWTALFSADFTDYEWNLTLVEDEQRAAFTEVYERMKKSDLVNTFIIMCDRLIPYKRSIGNPKALSDAFIMSMAGVEYTPFPFTKLNMKYIFSLPAATEPTRQFFLVVLNKAYDLSYRLWNEINTPDINVDDFVEIIMSNIKEIQKRPELNRCQKAFKKIEDSVHLLKGRFNDYYRDMVSAKNSTIMMEHFILDVSKSTKADPETTRQFRHIITFYRRIAQDQVSNPKVKMLFDKVEASFKELERGTSNLVNIKDDDADDESSDDDDAESAPGPAAVAAEPLADMHAARVESANRSIDELVAFIEGGRAAPKKN